MIYLINKLRKTIENYGVLISVSDHTVQESTGKWGNIFIYLEHRHSWTLWMTQDGAINGWQTLNCHFRVMLGWKLKFIYRSTTYSYSYTYKINASKYWTFKLKFLTSYYFSKWNQYQDDTIWNYKTVSCSITLSLFFPSLQTPVAPKNCSAFFYH